MDCPKPNPLRCGLSRAECGRANNSLCKGHCPFIEHLLTVLAFSAFLTHTELIFNHSPKFFFLILIAFKPPDLIHWVFLAKYAGNCIPVKFYLVYYSPLFQDVKGIIGHLEFWLWQNHSYYSFLVCMIFTLKAWLFIFLSSVKYNE